MVRRSLLQSSRLIGFFLTVLSLAACNGETSKPSTDTPAPQITTWIHSDTNLVSALSEEPRECLPPIANTQTTLGRLAFRSPFLLGGQAARRGLTWRLITKEFTGPEPTPEVESALLSYLRALDDSYCTGRLHNRFPNHPKLRAQLVAMSANLNTVKVENPDIVKLAADWDALEPDLRQAYAGSLFDETAIQNWIASR